MKKEWLGVAIMALTMAGCSQNEVTDVNNTPDKKNEISFDFSTGKRAVDATVATMQSDADGFMVFATQNNTSSPVMINNKPYNFSNGKWVWKDTQEADVPKWPTDSKLYPIEFYAYYPANLLTSNELAYGGLEKVIKVKPIDDQIDILAANKTNVIMKPSNSKITFTFEHIFSKIAFKANVATTAKAYIQSLSVHKVSDTRTYDFGKLAWKGDASISADYIFRASPTSGKQQIEIAATEGAITGDKTNAALMLLPQAYTEANCWKPAENTSGTTQSLDDLNTKANLQMLYRMTTISGAPDVVGYSNAQQHPDWKTSTWATNHSTYTDGLYVKVAYSLGVGNSWLAGKAYTYVFQLGTPQATGGYIIDKYFYDENGNVTDLLVKYPGGGTIDPGTPPFETGGNIDFDIIVKDWDTTHPDANKPLN